MATSTDGLAWKQIDVATLGAEAVKLWEAKRAQDAVARKAREEFEAHVNALVAKTLPPGKRLAMGYRFGKFSVAIADGETAKAKPAPTPLTLTQALGL